MDLWCLHKLALGESENIVKHFITYKCIFLDMWLQNDMDQPNVKVVDVFILHINGATFLGIMQYS